LTVLLDSSASMATCDSSDPNATDAKSTGAGSIESGSRFDEARRIADSLTARLGDRYDVQLQTFAAHSTPVEPAELGALKPEGQFTDLAAGIASLLQATAARSSDVLLSDGIHNVAAKHSCWKWPSRLGR